MKTYLKSVGAKWMILSGVMTAAMGLSSAQAALVGQWNFNENSGTVSVDTSGNGNNASLQGTAGWGSGVEPDDYAAVFDGTSATVDYGTSSLFTVGNQFALAVWVKPVAHAGEQLIFGKGYSFGLTYFMSGHAYFYGGGQGVSTALASDEWAFVVGVFDSGLATIYVNGVQANIANIGTTIPDTSGVPLMTGPNLYLPNLFLGSLSQAQIYNSALTGGEVADLYATGPVLAPIPEPSAWALAAAGLAVLMVWRRRSALASSLGVS